MRSLRIRASATKTLYGAFFAKFSYNKYTFYNIQLLLLFTIVYELAYSREIFPRNIISCVIHTEIHVFPYVLSGTDTSRCRIKTRSFCMCSKTPHSYNGGPPTVCVLYFFFLSFPYENRHKWWSGHTYEFTIPNIIP